MIMIEAEWPGFASRPPVPDGSSPVVIFVYVEDVDEVTTPARLENTCVKRKSGVDVANESTERGVLGHVADVRVHGHGIVGQRRRQVVEPAT